MKTNQEIISELHHCWCNCSEETCLARESFEDALQAKDQEHLEKMGEVVEFMKEYGHLNLGEGERAESLGYEWHCWKAKYNLTKD